MAKTPSAAAGFRLVTFPQVWHTDVQLRAGYMDGSPRWAPSVSKGFALPYKHIKRGISKSFEGRCHYRISPDYFNNAIALAELLSRSALLGQIESPEHLTIPRRG
jgi:hypothetical protein